MWSEWLFRYMGLLIFRRFFAINSYSLLSLQHHRFQQSASVLLIKVTVLSSPVGVDELRVLDTIQPPFMSSYIWKYRRAVYHESMIRPSGPSAPGSVGISMNTNAQCAFYFISFLFFEYICYVVVFFLPRYRCAIFFIARPLLFFFAHMLQCKPSNM